MSDFILDNPAEYCVIYYQMPAVLEVMPASTQSLSDAPGKPWLFKKGQAPIGGRRKGAPDYLQAFYKALRTVETKHNGLSFLEHAIARAYVNDKLIPPILDRLVPTLVSGFQTSPTSIMIVYGHAPPPAAIPSLPSVADAPAA